MSSPTRADVSAEIKRQVGECIELLGIPAATLAGLRDGTLVAVPIAGSTRMLSDVARKHYRSEAELFAIWCDCIAVFHPAAVEQMRAALAGEGRADG